MSKTALVTGGNRGLGLEIVKELAARGYTTLLGCRDVDQGSEAAVDLHGDIKVVHVDLSDSATLRKQVKDILERHDIDILINNGAILKDGSVLDAEPQDFYDSVQVNLVSCFDLIQEILPCMTRRGYGRIVKIGRAHV